jgi:hypothetical protein
MVTGQLPLQLSVDPLSGFMVLADGAVPIAAGTKSHVHLTAAAAIVYDQAASGGTARDDCLQGLDVICWHSILVSIEILRRELCEDVLYGSHGYTPFIRSLMIP